MLIQAGDCFITDLGLCGPVADESSGKIYGIIPYIAPEVLFEEEKNTKESDVYSIGMLMWEIFTGRPPFDDRAHDHHLIFDISEKGLQPPILPEMSDDYAQMMQKCWDMDPSKRPTIRELWDFADNKLEEIYKGKINSSNDNINVSNDDSSSSSDSPQQAHKSHPLAYHTSRILD